MKLFVYGTLLRGERNHHVMAGATLLFERCTLQAKMYDTGAGYPAIDLDKDFTVLGEVYEIQDHMWPGLDELEGHSGNLETDLYSKEIVNVQTDEGLVEAVVYTLCDATMRSISIPHGDWVTYRKSLEK